MAPTSHPPYPPLPPARPKPFLLMRNEANQSTTGAVFAQDGYTLAIVEFDDQGACYNRRQMQAMADALALLSGLDPVIIVFTHGWRRDGRSDDGNLQNFCLILKQAAIDVPNRPVFGVYVAWRGLSWTGPLVDDPTLWGRQEAAWRVALGSVRELFGRLRTFRNAERDAGRMPVLVIIGHSFGGLIVYSAVAQSLIEAAGTQAGQVVPGFSDMVLLVNPAFEATRYLPIYEQIKDRHDFVPNQLPVFVAVTAYNDKATKYLFPISAFIPALSESTRRGTHQRQAVLNTIGHIRWLRTHELSAPRVTTAAKDQAGFTPGPKRMSALHSALAAADTKVMTFKGGAELRRLDGIDAHNPYWIVGATKTVVDGHDGIFGEVFVEFVYDLVAAQILHPRRPGQAAAKASTAA